MKRTVLKVLALVGVAAIVGEWIWKDYLIGIAMLIICILALRDENNPNKKTNNAQDSNQKTTEQ